MNQWVVIESFANEMDATIAKGQLEATGIPCRVTLNQMGDTLLGVFGLQNGPTDISVRIDDAEAAKRIVGII